MQVYTRTTPCRKPLPENAPKQKASTKKTFRLETILSRLKTYPFNTSPVLYIKKYSKGSQQEIFAFVFIFHKGPKERKKVVVKYNISFPFFKKRRKFKTIPLQKRKPEWLGAIRSKRLCWSVLIGSNFCIVGKRLDDDLNIFSIFPIKHNRW